MIWTPNPTIFDETDLSSGVMEIPQENATWLYDTIAGFPGTGRYHHAVGGTYTYAQGRGVLTINYPVGDNYPIWGGCIFKTPGRDELYVVGAGQPTASQSPYKLQVLINGVLAEELTFSGTAYSGFGKTYSIGANNAYGVVDGDYYTVVIKARNAATGTTSTYRNPASFWVDQVEGRQAGGAIPDYSAALPRFDNAGDLSVADANTVLTELSRLYTRFCLHKQPAFSGIINGFFDSSGAMVGQWIRHFNYATPILPGRRTVRLRGRHEGRGPQSYNLQLTLNNAAIWSQSFANTFTTEPWELDIPASVVGPAMVSQGVDNGNICRLGLHYMRATGGHFPRPRITLDWLGLTGRDSSPLYAEQAPLPIGANVDPRPWLQQLRNNVQAVRDVYGRCAWVLERDLPYIWQWDTSARYMFDPHGDPNDVDRKEVNPTTGPAILRRWGDLLHIYAIRPRIVWGPRIYSYEVKGTDDESVTCETLFVKQLGDDPEQAVKMTIPLDAIETDSTGIAIGEQFVVEADRIYYIAQSTLDRQV